MKNLRGGLLTAATIALAGMLAACSSSSGASDSSAVSYTHLTLPTSDLV